MSFRARGCVINDPVGQKRLTNVAVVRLKKHGMRFEIACFKNKVLSWRSGIEKDIDEVLQSVTVYSNVSKGVLGKSKDMIAAFQTDDLSKICIEIMQKGELQVAGKERDSQLSSQFRDIATIVMQKTINPETKRPYSISMIEQLMHGIHFGVDPHSTSKKQALEVIRELQKRYPIKRAPMRLRLIIPEESSSSLMEKLNAWNADIASKDESGNQISLVCEMEPSFFRECDALVKSLHGRSEMLAVSVHFEKDTNIDHYDDHKDVIEPSHHPITSSNAADLDEIKLSGGLQKQSISTRNNGADKRSAGVEAVEVKQSKCSTCNVFVGDAKQYREHLKSEWHKHNLRRKTRQLPPLTADECLEDMDMRDAKSDLKEYTF
ncbi:ribosome maturation protein SBDS-like [Papaver somniferum]|uniref:ribosome maturation protein SBDS-like n=1 Tax=Papaver somniferum TaxID=3469 RepID=UPI000E6FBA47|nr:ribosome maturation protein SBDS-like [Papaver somniferum]